MVERQCKHLSGLDAWTINILPDLHLGETADDNFSAKLRAVCRNNTFYLHIIYKAIENNKFRTRETHTYQTFMYINNNISAVPVPAV